MEMNSLTAQEIENLVCNVHLNTFIHRRLKSKSKKKRLGQRKGNDKNYNCGGLQHEDQFMLAGLVQHLKYVTMQIESKVLVRPHNIAFIHHLLKPHTKLNVTFAQISQTRTYYR